jgi:molybdopterin converting factor small subunit
MTKLCVKFFGRDALAIGYAEMSLDVASFPTTCAALRRQLAVSQPRLVRSLANARFAVNYNVVVDDHPITAGDEVAIINTITGG